MIETNDNNEPKRETMFLSGLLHDIGKFWQRADQSLASDDNQLSDYSKRLANDICSVNDQGRFGYQHVIWTNEFLEKFAAKLNLIPGVKDNLYDPDNRGENNLMNFAVNHHRPQSIYQGIITLADWWSAGIDRTKSTTFEKEEKSDDVIRWGWQRYKKIPLYSIFNIIHQGGFQSAFPLKPLSVEHPSYIFPKNIKRVEDGIDSDDYKQLWDGFIDEVENLPVDSLMVFIESLLFLLKKYTWCIPSNTMDMANVSLYEHLKTTAAFADCLYVYYQEYSDHFTWNNVTKRLSIVDKVKPVMLVGGDISGIQSFIYNIASRKAAQSLKGRSFYLQLLIDSFIHKIISHPAINATLGHIVYSSGGKFFMLLPNTADIAEALNEVSLQIEQFLWDEHKGKIIFNIATVPFSYGNNGINFGNHQNAELGLLWKEVADKLARKKQTKFRSTIQNNFSALFEPEPCGGDRIVCVVSGIELMPSRAKALDVTEGVYVSTPVYDQIKLGAVLKDVDYAITFKGPSNESKYLSNRSKHQQDVADVATYLFDQAELTRDEADFRGISSYDVNRVMRINNTHFLVPLKGTGVSYGFRFYGGNKQALMADGKNKTFEQITRIEPGSKESCATYFAVLRMDVDGLGDIFINGLNSSDKSFSAYATLSFLLDLFFSGYINYIRNDFKDANNRIKYRDWVNVLYSGGDDVFAVGRWDKIIEFAADVRREFARFTGRDDISISAGITITGNKYPIAKAAQMAGEAEDKAKRNLINGAKNALCLFGETISWKEEYEYVTKIKEQFVYLVGKKEMAKSILHNIMQFSILKKEGKDLSYLWHTVYYLKRFRDRYKENNEIREFAEYLQKELFQSRKYDLVALSARWAELYLREIYLWE